MILARVCALALAVFALALPALAQPQAAGTWHTISDVNGKPRGIVRIEQLADGGLRGVAAGSLVAGEDPNQVCAKCPGGKKNKPLVGMEILWGLKPVKGKPGQWAGGQVLDPDSGNIYSARLGVSPDGQTLTLRGFLGVAALGRSQTWKRAP
jgi:uncharacterized protein (DUF2147 family)